MYFHYKNNMLILGVEPSLTAYKTVVRTDTLYELYGDAVILVYNVGIEPTNQE